MSINPDYLQLLDSMECLEGIPPLAGIYLPPLVQHPDFVDEFGFVFLADGSAGPFYVSLEDTLARLWDVYPKPAAIGSDAPALARGLASQSLHERAVALGAFNALSQHLMRRARYQPPPRGTAGGPQPRAGETIGMVGYFCPVIDQLVERGVHIRLLEQQPERVPVRPGVSVEGDPAALIGCRIVICTASALINDSLDSILAGCTGAESVELIGPSGSGLPDALLERGVRVVGGIRYPRAAALKASLKAGENWGHTGKKYEITRESYPGLDALVSRICERH